MAALPEPLTALVSALSKLPGIGPRSAERIALHIVQTDPIAVSSLAKALVHARESVRPCDICGALTEKQSCSICADSRRDSALLCLVERAVDIISLEKPGTYHGKYHVLGGKISPLNGVGPEDLRIGPLQQRLTQEPIREVIVALPSDVEGDATSFYISKLLTGKVKLSRIAHGLAVGGALGSADELTLSRALEGRREF